MRTITKLLLLLTFTFSFSSAFSQATTTSLTACYALDGNATELINNLTGTLSSVTSAVDRNSNANSALYFSGSTSSYVELPDNPLIKPNFLTFSAWIKPVTLSNAYVLFTKNSNTTNIDAYSLSTVSVSAGYKFRVTRTNGATTHTAECTTTLTANTWYHVAFTMDNIYLKIYVNGVYQGAVTSTVGFDYVSGKKVILGGTNETTNLPFDGVIDNAKFYNRTLTASEITTIYNNDFSCIPTPPPNCTDVFYSINTASALVHVSNTGQTNTSTLTSLQLPVGAQCLAIGPSFSFTAPNPTYWTIANGTYWYYNGSGFYDTNHSCGTTVYSQAGGSKNYLYNLYFTSSLLYVYKYNGTGNATAITIPTFPGSNICQDVVGDDNDNIYLLQCGTPQSLLVYNSSGIQTCSYSVSGLPTNYNGVAFAISGNTVTTHNTFYYTGLISGSTVSFTQALNQTFPTPGDFANCAIPVNSFTASITSSPSPSVSCFTPTITLTANAPVSSASYTWSGPGISGSTHNISAQVTSAGTYTCFLRSCQGGTSVATYTVLNDPYQLIPVAVTSNTIDCYNPFAQLSVSPNSASNTIIWNGPSIFGANNTPSISVTGGGIYTVSVSNTLNACAGSATVNVSGNTAPLSLSILPSNTLICQPAPNVSLSVTGLADTYSWSPVSSSNTLVIVNPSSTTTYTVYGNTGVCSGSAVVTVSANVTPTLINVSGNPTVCSGNLTNLTFSGASSYTWMPGNLSGATVTITPSTTTVYTVTGANGFCTALSTLTLNTLTSPVVSVSASAPVICAGGSSQLSASGASSYTWEPGTLSGSTLTVNPLVNTVYTLSGSNAAGCTGTQTILITVNQNPTVTISASSASVCSGKSATLSGLGASSYTWYPGGTTGNNLLISPLSLTVYSLVGSSNGCPGSASISIAVNSNPTVNASVSNTTICSGNSVTLSAGGALTYTWFPGALAGQNISASPSGNTTYTVTGEDGVGCKTDALVSVSVNPSPALVLTSSTPSICNGSSATLSVSGAATYTWNPIASNNFSVSVNPSISSTYSVSGTNAFGCISTTTTVLTVINIPTITVAASPLVICAGKTTTLSASGATSYTWNPGTLNSSVAIVSPASSTQYTVTGANGACVSTTVLTVVVNTNPTVLSSSSPASICSGATSSLSAFGANSYTWLPGNLIGNSVSVNPLTTTVYTVTGMFSSTGCTSTANSTVSVTTTPTLSLAFSSVTICTGTPTVLGASGATNYTWNPGSLSGANVTVSPSSNTIYTVTGANGSCIDTKTVFIATNSNPTLTATSNTASVCGGTSASLTATGALNYTWSPAGGFGSTAVVTPSSTITYTVSGNNSVGCISTATILLGYISSPTLYASASPSAVCQGGTLALLAAGAGSYFWNPGLGSGSYLVVTPSVSAIYTLSGSSGPCTSTQTLAITVYTNAIVQANSSSGSICMGNTVTLNSTGATNYTWNPGSFNGSNVTLTPTISTTYTVIGDNSGGCSNTATVHVTVNPVTTPTINNSPGSICSGNSSTLGLSGLTSYTWYPLNTTSPFIVVSPSVTTIYTLSGTNILGCPSSATSAVNVTQTPTLSLSASASTICAGGSTSLSSLGATNYTWNPGALSGSLVSVSPLINTIYTVTGANGACISSKTLAIISNPSPSLTVSGTSTLCSGNSASLTISGASTYTWYPGAIANASVSFSPTSMLIYTVTGSFTNGCSSTFNGTLAVTPQPTVNLSISSTSICSGTQATLIASGASSYSWVPGGLSGSLITVSPSQNTTYTVTGFNAACANSQTVVLAVNPSPSIATLPINPSICAGESVSLSAMGALNYTWYPGNQNGSNVSVSPSVTTIYTVTGSNGGCYGATTINILVYSSSLSVVSSNSLICAGESVTLSASGANTYLWSTGDLSPTLTVSPSVTSSYTVTGTDSNQCESSLILQQLVSDCTGLEAISTTKRSYLLYPNPGNGEFFIQLSELNINTSLEIYNSIGDLIHTQKINNLVNPLNLESVSKGIYMLVLKENGKLLTTLRLIKE